METPQALDEAQLAQLAPRCVTAGQPSVNDGTNSPVAVCFVLLLVRNRN